MSKPSKDGRPEGWTEALALEFIAERGPEICHDEDDVALFADLFVSGGWPEIQRDFPEFQRWLDDRWR